MFNFVIRHVGRILDSACMFRSVSILFFKVVLNRPGSKVRLCKFCKYCIHQRPTVATCCTLYTSTIQYNTIQYSMVVQVHRDCYSASLSSFILSQLVYRGCSLNCLAWILSNGLSLFVQYVQSKGNYEEQTVYVDGCPY